MQRAIRTLLIRECIEASELLILFSIHPPWRVREQIRFPTHTYSFRIIEIFWNCYYSLKVEVWNKNSISIFLMHACLPFHTTIVTLVLFFRKIFSPTYREDVGRDVLFEYHRAVVPFCLAVRPVRTLSTL